MSGVARILEGISDSSDSNTCALGKFTNGEHQIWQMKVTQGLRDKAWR